MKFAKSQTVPPEDMMEATDKKLLDRACTELCRSVRDAIRLKHYSIRTEEAYAHWIKRYIYFHNVRHPAEMGAPEVQAFLTHLAVNENVAASTQNQGPECLPQPTSCAYSSSRQGRCQAGCKGLPIA